MQAFEAIPTLIDSPTTLATPSTPAVLPQQIAVRKKAVAEALFDVHAGELKKYRSVYEHSNLENFLPKKF